MKVFAKSIIITCAALIVTTVLMTTAFASAGFTTSPELPENQREGIVNYFDVFLQPGQSQDLALIVENVTDREIAITTEVLAVATNEAGDIVYVPGRNLELMQGEEVGHTPEFIMTDHLQLHQDYITIQPNSYGEITFTVTMPTISFQGTILGAINVVREPTDTELAEAGNFLFEFANVVAVRMQQAVEPAEPGFELHSVRADLVMHRATFVVNIVNTEKRVIRSAQVNVRIYPENSSDPIIEYTNETISLAPDSLLPLSIRESESEGLQSGNYIAIVNLLYDGREWNFERTFEITAEAAARINEDAINVATTELNMPLWVIATIALGAILIIGTFIIIIAKARASKKKYEKLLQQVRNSPQPLPQPQAHPQSHLQEQYFSGVAEQIRNSEFGIRNSPKPQLQPQAYSQPHPQAHPQPQLHPHPQPQPQPQLQPQPQPQPQQYPQPHHPQPHPQQQQQQPHPRQQLHHLQQTPQQHFSATTEKIPNSQKQPKPQRVQPRPKQPKP